MCWVLGQLLTYLTPLNRGFYDWPGKMAQNQTRSIKSGGSKRDFTDFTLVAPLSWALKIKFTQ